jgi:hypothetical protein
MSDILEAPLDLLRAALPAVSTEPRRHYLCGVYFDPAGWIVATNGHVLFAAHVPDVAGWAGRGSIVSGKQIEQAVKGRSTTNVAVLDLDRGNVIVGACGNKVLAPIVDGTFPDWRRVLPADCHGAPVPAHFLPGPMQSIYKMAKALGLTACTGARDDAESPHPVVFGERTDCFAVIMPARIMCRAPSETWAAMARP